MARYHFKNIYIDAGVGKNSSSYTRSWYSYNEYGVGTHNNEKKTKSLNFKMLSVGYDWNLRETTIRKMGISLNSEIAVRKFSGEAGVYPSLYFGFNFSF